MRLDSPTFWLHLYNEIKVTGLLVDLTFIRIKQCCASGCEAEPDVWYGEHKYNTSCCNVALIKVVEPLPVLVSAILLYIIIRICLIMVNAIFHVIK